MAARQLRLLRAYHRRASRGYEPTTEAIVIAVEQAHLKSRPVDQIELTDDQAIDLAWELLRAVRHKRGAIG